MLSFPFLHYFAKKKSEKKKSVACVANMFSFQFSWLTHTLLPRIFHSSTNSIGHFLVVITNGANTVGQPNAGASGVKPLVDSVNTVQCQG